MSDGSVGQGSGSKRTVERIGLDWPPRAEIFRKNALDQCRCRCDVDSVAGQVIGEANGAGSAFAGRFDARAGVICSAEIFRGDSLHVDGVFDRAELPARIHRRTDGPARRIKARL